MSAITITLSAICPGGGHFTFSATGDINGSLPLDVDEVISPLTLDDARSFARVIAWMAKNGRTLAQAKTLLQSGVTITV